MLFVRTARGGVLLLILLPAVVVAAVAASHATMNRLESRHFWKSRDVKLTDALLTAARNLQATVAAPMTMTAADEATDATATERPHESLVQCLDASTVNFGDAFSQTVYGSDEYDATCTCTEQDNAADVMALLSTLPLPDNATATPQEIEAYMTSFNNASGALVSGHDYNCTSGCATCFSDEISGGDYCGTLTIREVLSIQGRATNYTYDDLLNGFNVDSDDSFVSDLTYETGTCFTYVSGEPTGQVCLTLDYAGVESSSSSSSSSSDLPNCILSYNGEPCNTCTMQTNNVTELLCYVADCSNIETSTTTRTGNVDFCTQTGLEGPFRVLQYLWGAENVTAYTKGTCKSDLPAVPTNTSETGTIASTTNVNNHDNSTTHTNKDVNSSTTSGGTMSARAAAALLVSTVVMLALATTLV